MINNLVIVLLSSILQCENYNLDYQGFSVSPLFMPGDILTISPKECTPPVREGFVIFETRANERPVVKMVAGLPGDTMKLEVSPNGTYIIVNDRKVFSPKGKPYKLKRLRDGVLYRYQGILRGYLLIGNENSLDSSVLGVLHEKNITGTVIHVYQKK